MEDNIIDAERAWKDQEYRKNLTPEQLAQLPPNPAGDEELAEEELDQTSGGTYKIITFRGPPPTTISTFLNCFNNPPKY